MGMDSISRLISIVDDDPLLREGLISLLRSAGFAAQAFASGIGAAKVARIRGESSGTVITPICRLIAQA